MRPSGRTADEMRVVRFTPDYTRHAEGSVLAQFGGTSCKLTLANRLALGTVQIRVRYAFSGDAPV